MAKLSQILLNPPCNSRILASDKLIRGHVDFKALPEAYDDRYYPIFYFTYGIKKKYNNQK